MEQIAAANNELVQHVSARLADGSLADGFDPLPEPTTLGVGQSMGGQFLLVLQAHHTPFHGIGVLGYSAIHTVVPSRPGTAGIPFPWIVRSTAGSAPVIVNADRLSGELSLGGHAGQENPLQWAFHFDDESPEIVAADMTADSLAPWRSATAPECAVLGVAPGVVATEAASITVPVFVGVGERDVVPDPWLEPMAYRSANDVTLFVCPRMAHMHNFASTRERLWQRLHGWGSTAALAHASS
jgi:pimeloyl-ACP methyl ester carboxylesterase